MDCALYPQDDTFMRDQDWFTRLTLLANPYEFTSSVNIGTNLQWLPENGR